MDDGHARTGSEAQRLCAFRRRDCVTASCVKRKRTASCVSRSHRVAGVGEGVDYHEAIEIRENGLTSLWDVI
eukprot:1989518-Prymnesium_polylepis.2